MIAVLIAALLGLGLCVAVVAAEKRRRLVGVGATGDDHAAASAGLSQGTVQVQGTQWHAQTAASSGKYVSCSCVCRRIESAAAAVRACLSLPAGFLPPSASSWKPSQAKPSTIIICFLFACIRLSTKPHASSLGPQRTHFGLLESIYPGRF
jgi:hypothetical protein